MRIGVTRRNLWLSLPVLLGGFAALVWRLNEESIWHDEGWSIRAIGDPINTPDDNTPYLYYAAGHFFWRLGTGETPFSFRYTSVLIALLGIALAVRVGGRWYGTWAGLTAGVMVASSPLLWEYGQEVRAYVAVPVLALATLALVDRLLAHSRTQLVPPGLWISLFGVQVVGLYTHNLMVPVIVWLNVAVGMVWLLRQDWQRMFTWAGIEIALILAYVPWLLTQSPSGTPLNTPPEFGLQLGVDIWRSYFLPALAQFRAADEALLIDLAGLALLVLGIATLLGNKRRSWLLLSHALLIPVFSTILLIVANIDFHPRYYVAAVPGTLLLMVGGVAALKAVTDERVMYVGWTVLAIGSVFIAQNSLNEIAETPAYQHDDFESLARYYAGLPDDTVILIPYNREPALQNYYADQFDIQADFINIELYEDDETALAQINQLVRDAQSQHVELLTWFQLPADARGMYPCLLTASSEDIGLPQRFFGLETRAYHLVSELRFRPLPEDASYQQIDLQEIAWAGSRQGICVQTDWTLREESSEDFELAMGVLNPLGWEIARSDVSIRDREQVRTSELEAGESAQAFNLIELPDGAPLTDYGLEWTVYSEARPEGVDVFTSEGQSRGKSFLTAPVRIAGPPLSINSDTSITTRVIEDNTDGTRTLDGTQPLEVTLVLTGLDDDNAFVALQGEGWSSELQAAAYQDEPILSWHRFRLGESEAGPLQLVVNDVPIETYTLLETNRIFDAPDFETSIEAEFPGIGTLVGSTFEQNAVSPNVPPQIELVWQAENGTDISYTVFVQLLDTSWRLIGQSDQQPANGQRPTTGWQVGEFIEDNHSLDFRVEDYEGPAFLIVGLYNSADPTRRALAEDGNDYVRLPFDVTVVLDN